MGRIRWFFLRLAIGVILFAGVSVIPARADVSAYLVSLHPISTPAGARSLCANYDWACATVRKKTAFDPKDLSLVKKINGQINRRVPQVTDQSQYASSEVWALPTRRGGDCEDFALLKKRELMRRGVAANRLLIATVLDKQRKSHAVLVVRTHRGDIVLDNMTNQILAWDKTGYIFLKMQNPKQPTKWDAVLAGGALLRRSVQG